MKLIIDIPEKIEEYIKDYIPIGAGNNAFCYPDEIVRMIQNGTAIPDNATNGDVIKAMFPQAYVDESRYETPFIDVTYEGEVKSFSESWWNSPYQKGGKNEAN